MAVSYDVETRNGDVVRECREHYVRRDIDLGYLHGNAMNDLGEDVWIVVDTNIVLHQIDFLEALSSVIVTQTVFNEVKHQDRKLLKRLVAALNNEDKKFLLVPNEHIVDAAVDAYDRYNQTDATANDRNDRAIRAVASYLLHLSPRVLLVSDDVENRSKAKTDGIAAYSSLDYCTQYNEDLKPLLAAVLPFGNNEEEEEKTKEALFPRHLPMSELSKGIADKGYFQGALICTTSHDIAFVDTDSKRLCVRGAQNINRAISGDIVVVEKTSQTRIEPEHGRNDIELKLNAVFNEEEDFTLLEDEARVVGIVRRNWKANYCGSIHENIFVPVDIRLPRIKVARVPPSITKNDRVCVAIDAWPSTEALPLGHYVTRLGDAGDKEVETQILLREHAIEVADFSSRVIACLPEGEHYDFKPDQREDLRECLTVCSIDPPGCRDIDDALSAVHIDKDKIEVGIHIADVTHFCKPGTPLDEEARSRGTSTYLVDRRLDMLPKKLTERLCSLRAGVDRYAFSAFITLDQATGKILNEPRFVKSIICSRAALTYHEAQLMIQGESPGDEVADSVRRLASIARTLRKNRMTRGALTLATPEVKFALANESDTPTDVGAYQLVEANATVEEFMLLANICVANKILKVYPGLALLRHHPEPPQDRFAPLKSKASIGLNVQLDTTSNLSLAQSLDQACSTLKATDYSQKLLRCLATWCMAPARYFCAADKSQGEWQHYGLAADVYTHFTSPIRRYADVVVHRLLAAAAGIEPLPSHSSRELIADIALHLNRRSKAAQYAARDSVALYTRLYFKEHPQSAIEAIVVDVDPKAQTIIVLVPRFGVQGKLVLSNHDLSFPALHTASYDSNRLKVFDSIFVDVKVVHSDRNPLGEVAISLASSSQISSHHMSQIQAPAPKIQPPPSLPVLLPKDKQHTTAEKEGAASSSSAASAAAMKKKEKVASVLQHLPVAPVPAPSAAHHPASPFKNTQCEGVKPPSPPVKSQEESSPVVAPQSQNRRRRLQEALDRKNKKSRS